MSDADSTEDMKECPFCHERIKAVAIKCRYCEEYLDGKKRKSKKSKSGLNSDAAERMLLPVGRPISAIAAGYLALIGVLPVFGLLFSIGAVVCGFVALNAIKKDPDLSGAGRAWFGIILGGLMTLISMIAIMFIVIGSLSQRRF